MSRRRCRTTGTAIAALAATIVFSATACAADPNVPPAEKASVPKAMTPSSSKPAPPAKPTPALFTPQMPFSEAMDILRNSTTPPLNIVVLWKEIGENAGVYRETPIGIDGVPGLRAGQYLELLLLSLSGSASAKLGYRVKDGVITVGTTDSLRPPRKVTRVYDISDLVAEPARYPFSLMGFGGAYGGSMMAPGGYGGGYGTGSIPGTSYAPAGSGGGRGLASGVGNLYGGARRPGLRRR